MTELTVNWDGVLNLVALVGGYLCGWWARGKRNA